MNREEFAQAVLRYRLDNGLSQQNLGEKFGVTQQTACNWEKGNIPRPPILRKLCSLMGLDLREIQQLSGQRKVSNTQTIKGNSNVQSGESSTVQATPQIAPELDELMRLLSEYVSRAEIRKLIKRIKDKVEREDGFF